MIKRMIGEEPRIEHKEPEWMALEQVAEVEISSEEASRPIEGALIEGGRGWRADRPGEQTIRLLFPQPKALKRIRLIVEELERTRTQEFVLRTSSPGGLWREIARQQFNFSPTGATREQETYHVDLPAVSVLELRIVPEIGGGEARASLQELRVG